MDEDIIKEAQLRKLESEIARNAAEEKKILSEVNEIDKRASKGIIQPDSIIKAVIGGVVAAALLAAWAISYLQPLLGKKEELAGIQNQITQDSLQVLNKLSVQQQQLAIQQQQQANRQLKDVQNQNDSIKNEQKKSKELIENLQNKLRQIGNEFQRLSEQDKATKADKEKYAKLAEDAKSTSYTLQKQLVDLTVSQQRTENRSINISDQLIANFLMSSDWNEEDKWSTGYTYSSIWTFKPNGKLLNQALPSEINSWEIRDGKLTIKYNDNYVIYTAKISQSQNEIEGTGSNKEGKTCTWKITKK